MKQTIDNSVTAIREWLNKQDSTMLFDLHNHYCYERGYSDDVIYHNDEDFFTETFHKASPFELIQAIQGGDYNINHDYVQIDAYGCLNTSDDVNYFVYQPDILVDMYENPNDYDLFVRIK